VAVPARRVRVGPLVARVPPVLLAHRAHPGRLDPAVDHREVPAALVPRARVVRPVPRAVPADRDHQSALAPRVARYPVAQVDPAVHPVLDHRAATRVAVDLKVVPKVDQVANRDPDRVRSPAPNPDRSPVRKVAASLLAQVPDHRDQVVAVLAQAAVVPAVRAPAANHPVEAPAAARDPVDQARAPVPGVDPVPAELAPVVSAARGNRTGRAVLAVVFQEAADRVPRVVVAVPAITSGTGSVGCPSRFPIRVLSRTDRSRQSAYAQETSQPVRVPTSVKSFTRDANKV
jgi:hypothetical protein